MSHTGGNPHPPPFEAQASGYSPSASGNHPGRLATPSGSYPEGPASVAASSGFELLFPVINLDANVQTTFSLDNTGSPQQLQNKQLVTPRDYVHGKTVIVADDTDADSRSNYQFAGQTHLTDGSAGVTPVPSQNYEDAMLTGPMSTQSQEKTPAMTTTDVTQRASHDGATIASDYLPSVNDIVPLDTPAPDQNYVSDRESFVQNFVRRHPPAECQKDRLSYHELLTEFFTFYDELISKGQLDQLIQGFEVGELYVALNTLLLTPHPQTFIIPPLNRMFTKFVEYANNGFALAQKYNMCKKYMDSDEFNRIKRAKRSHDNTIDNPLVQNTQLSNNCNSMMYFPNGNSSVNMTNNINSNVFNDNNCVNNDVNSDNVSFGISNINRSNIVNSDSMSNVNSVIMPPIFGNTSIHNNVVSNSNDCGEDMDQASHDPQPHKKQKYVLYCEIRGNWMEFLKTFSNDTQLEPAAELKGDLIRFTCEDLDTFRLIQRYLKEKQIPCQTLDPQNDRPKKYLLRGIPTNTPTSEIMEFLTAKGFTPLRCAYLTNRKTKKPMPLFMVALRPQPNLENIYSVNNFNFLKIKVEDFHSSPYKQCYNCQAFGHSSMTCSLTPKCVRCAGSHRAQNCPLSKEDRNATCANCGGNHPASYRGCIKNPIKNKKQQNPKAVPLNTNPKTKQPTVQKVNNTTNIFTPAPLPIHNPWNLLPAPSTDLNTPPQVNSNTDLQTTPQNTATSRADTSKKPQAKGKQTNASPPLHSNSKQTPSQANQPQRQTKTKTSESPQTSSSPSASFKSLGDNFGGLGDIIKFVKEINDIIPLRELITLFKLIMKVIKSPNPIDNIMEVFDYISEHCSPSPCHG